jgi:hypothetical protein
MTDVASLNGNTHLVNITTTSATLNLTDGTISGIIVENRGSVPLFIVAAATAVLPIVGTPQLGAFIPVGSKETYSVPKGTTAVSYITETGTTTAAIQTQGGGF